MINIEQAVIAKFPSFAHQPKVIRNSALSFLKKMTHQNEVNAFLEKNSALRGFEFIDAVFDYFGFSYTVSARQKANIPAEGRLLIIANHPIGSLDGLALLRLISEVRSDVRILANDMLMNFEALHSLFIPIVNMGSGNNMKGIKAVLDAFNREQAVIIFPSGEVSRARPLGVRDGKWRPGFLHFARKANVPILPVHIGAKNSWLFYSASMLFKPFGTALLAHEMFNKRSATIRFSIGETIAPTSLQSSAVHDRILVNRLKKHVYKIARPKSTGVHTFKTVRTVAHPEDRRVLQNELRDAQLLGETKDQNRIYLFDAFPNSAVLREIGRLREISFRKAGEGTGSKRDLDRFDFHYRHLVLWDRERLEIAGAYRIAEGASILKQHGERGFYTNTLYHFSESFHQYLAQGIELGRSFVNPDYWGKASLDYLWQGLGAYLAHNPDVRYVIGPVSMSADYSQSLMEALVYYYQRYYGGSADLVFAHIPFELEPQRKQQLDAEFDGLAGSAAFDHLNGLFQQQQKKLPVLFKQYAALYEEGGFKALAFSVDPDFGDCLDGMCLGDLTKLKENRRKRYIGK